LFHGSQKRQPYLKGKIQKKFIFHIRKAKENGKSVNPQLMKELEQEWKKQKK